MSLQDLFKVPTIKKAWRAGHHQVIQHDDVSLSEMCEDLNTCVKKLPLNTSSVLITGAARAYSAEVDELFNDVMKLEKDLRTRNKRRTSESDEDELSRSTYQAESTSELEPPSQPESTPQSKIISRPDPTSQLVSSSQPESTSQSGPTSQSVLTSPLESTPQSVSTFQLESTSQRGPASPPGSISQHGSSSRPGPKSRSGSPSQPESTSGSGYTSEPRSIYESVSPVSEPQQSECSTDDEEFSPTYTTSETKLRESLIHPVRYTISLTDITEEGSSVYRRAGQSVPETPEEIDKSVLSNRLKPKRSEKTSDLEVELSKGQKSDSDAATEHEILELTDVLDVPNKGLSYADRDFDEMVDRTTADMIDNDVRERRSSEQSIILQPYKTLKAKGLGKRSKKKDAGTSLKGDHGTHVRPLQSNLLELGQLLVNAGTSPIRNMRNQETQVSPRPSNVSEAGPSVRLDRSQPFGAISLYSPCECDPRIPCVTVYCNVEGQFEDVIPSSAADRASQSKD